MILANTGIPMGFYLMPRSFYKVFDLKMACRNGKKINIDNAAHFPDPSTIESIKEPWVIAHVMIPADYMGAVMNLGMEKRGECIKTDSVDDTRLLLTYRLPLNEIISDFNDKLKSYTRGYGSFDYEMDDYQTSEIIKLEIKVNEEVVDAFSCLVHRTKAETRGRAICEKLKEVIPRQLFKVPKLGVIAGCYVTDGKVTRGAEVRLLRDNVVIHTGKVSSLRRFKDDASEVKQGYECGIGIAGYNDLKESDVIEFFEMVAVAVKSL